MVVGALVLCACHNATQEAECDKFIQKVDDSLVEINKHTQRKSLESATTVAEMTELAALYDKLAVDIGRMPISTSALAARTEDYRRMAQSAASAARHLAKAVADKDPPAVAASDKEFKQVVAREAALIASINELCKR